MIRTSTKAEAWKIARGFLSERAEALTFNEELSARAGYPVYEAEGGAIGYEHINDLNARLEYVAPNGIDCVNIWIDDEPEKRNTEVFRIEFSPSGFVFQVFNH